MEPKIENIIQQPESWNRKLGYITGASFRAMPDQDKKLLLEKFNELDELIFPEEMLMPEGFYSELLTSSENVVVTTLLIDEEFTGFSLSHPISECTDELAGHGDSNIVKYKDDTTVAYLETIAINPEEKFRGSFNAFFHEHLDALRKNGFKKVVFHARQSTLSAKLKHLGYKVDRVVENWFGDEGFDFYEINLD
jgi:hypothetical protein